MSNNTLVVYLKDPKIKIWLEKKSTKSTSSFVSKILEDAYQKDLSNNSLSKFAGILTASMTESELKEYENSIQEIQKNRVSRSQSYYDNLSN